MNKTNPGVALVTGTSTGIGRATAKALQNAGFRVFGTSRRAAAGSSDGVTMLTCDVTDGESVAKLIDDVLAEANLDPRPFRWTKDPHKIIAAVKRGHQVLDSIH